ncbi:AAA family ATPase [Streptomyces sp. BPTC-684]|uniref:AAA family ATPase n=1 Tax=Streptomyces sp. BPTC-684 TaxID=3043734 RepID=UPI0024B111C1|nr:AAA family ATPase [Streptomyces sp. BPTC-684]WHM41127.1 AAA family ATPase [Streptomyces sp. BPTC-684]
METIGGNGVAGKEHPGWEPRKLRACREAHGLTLEAAGEELRKIAETVRIRPPIQANFQTVFNHEARKAYPDPRYQRAYCLLYNATPWELGFRHRLSHEETPHLPKITPRHDAVTGAHVQAVESALLQIDAAGEVDQHGLRHRILDAWRRRHTGGDPHRPHMVLVGGYAGSGKSELAEFISYLTGWPRLDKDSLTRPLVEALLTAHGGDPHDRHSPLYLEKARDAEYTCLMESAYDNIRAGISTVLDAPFLKELSDPAWIQRLANKCRSFGAELAVIWVRCDHDSMREYITLRSAARDAWKLANWDEYIKGVDENFAPKTGHFVVDNRLGSAVSMTDQAKLALGRLYA